MIKIEYDDIVCVRMPDVENLSIRTYVLSHTFSTCSFANDRVTWSTHCPERTKISRIHCKVISQTSPSTCCDSFCCHCVNNADRNIHDTCRVHVTDNGALAPQEVFCADRVAKTPRELRNNLASSKMLKQKKISNPLPVSSGKRLD